MYVDESGDTGTSEASPTRYFCLTGLVVHELRWTETMRSLLQFRHWLKTEYRVYLDDELHAGDMINKPRRCPASLQSLRKHERLAIVRHHADQLARIPDIRLINVVFDKRQSRELTADEVFRRAWYALFQRFENTMLRRNFPGSSNEQERGIVFTDQTDAQVLKRHLEHMRVRNPLFIRKNSGSYTTVDEPIRLLIEDPVSRDSKHSYFIQAVDCAAFLFKQHIEPNSFMKKHGANAYFRTRLKPVLCLAASRTNDLGIVHL
ncbi:MAG: DUF3800 domain-containing protein [Phycisphaeraceae bacterium]|nr:DUF3800 domain-containing protein [Phycisphaeraceae bacterium]